MDGYFKHLVFWSQWDYRLNSEVFLVGYLRLAMIYGRVQNPKQMAGNRGTTTALWGGMDRLSDEGCPIFPEVEGPMNHLEMARPCKANKQNKAPTAQRPD